LNDADVVRAVCKDFVPVAANVWSIQAGEAEQAVWFQTMAKRLFAAKKLESYLEQYPTFQGVYVAGADGTPYELLGDYEPASTLRTLAAALEDFRNKPPGPCVITDEQIARAAPPRVDPTTTVIRLHYRCRPLPLGAGAINASVSRDHLWIHAAEVRSLIELTAAARIAVLPRGLALRLCRFHLLDNVRGMADPFLAEEVQRADFVVRVLGERDGVRRLALGGDFRSEKDYPGDLNYRGKVGVEGLVDGELDLDLATARIVRFRALAVGHAWGANSNTWGQPRGGRFPLVIALVDVDDEVARTVPPMWLGFGGY